MPVKIIGVNSIAPELRKTMANLGDRAIFLLANKVTIEAKKNVPILSSYGRENRNTFPHENKASAGTIKRSIKTVPSIKMRYSYLINAQDWRSRFVEYGTKPHNMPKSKRGTRKRKYAFLGREGGAVYRSKIRHPGTQGAKFLDRAASDNNVDRFVGEVITEMNNGK